MKKIVNRLSDDDLKQYPINNLIDGWFFRVLETSQNCYRVEGIDRWGRSVSRTGSEYEINEMIKKCEKDAAEINKNLEDS